MAQLVIPVSKKDHIRGSPKAPATLVEYGDFECPYCGQAFPIVEKVLAVEGDKLQFVFRNFPLTQIHQHAFSAALAAEAAGLQGKFWEMHHLLFENQHALEDQDLTAYAESLDLDVSQFAKNMESPTVEQKVREDFSGGIRSGVNGTPTFFINGLRYDGSYQYEFLLTAIEEVLGESS